LRSTAVLVLACAYLFTACLTAAHTLSFPGLFSPTGLLGAGPQTTAWLYMFWHAGFPLLVIAYARIRARSRNMATLGRRFGRHSIAIGISAALTAALGCLLLATAGHDALPAIMLGNRYTPAMMVVVTTVCALSLLALVAVWRRRSKTVLDLWLMVVMCAWFLDIALSAVLNAGRFDLGFYAGRIYGLLATSFVLVMLLLESGRLYALLIQTHKSDRRKAAELRRLSALDPLTGIANRRAFEDALDEEWRRTLRHRTPLCLIMIDVDYFKRFNDTYGHVAGDQCLRAVARVLADSARRAGEVVARYGGEEFAVLLPHTGVGEAHLLAQRICQEVRDLDIPHAQSVAANHVTISIGLADALALFPAG
jgi:diguanylate cyclase (GGDEF)-like protein